MMLQRTARLNAGIEFLQIQTANVVLTQRTRVMKSTSPREERDAWVNYGSLQSPSARPTVPL